MSKIKRGILGGFSGKVANVVGSSWKGIAVMKSLPLSVANPRTPKQVAQRHKFKAGSALATKVKALILLPFWNPLAEKMSGFNAFMKENVQHFHDTGAPVLEDIQITIGKIAPVTPTGTSWEPVNHSLTIEWSPDEPIAGASPNDRMIGILIDSEANVLGQTANDTVLLSDGMIDVEIDKSITPVAPFRAYLSRRQLDTNITSRSKNIEVTFD